MVSIAKALDVEIHDNDIEACHRLKGKNNSNSERTIVRFTNRKFCETLQFKKSKLREKKIKEKLNKLKITGNIYINPNLCPYMRFIWGKCKKLYDEKLINRFWIYNGYVYIAQDEESDKVKITHLDDLVFIFPGYNFDTKF